MDGLRARVSIKAQGRLVSEAIMESNDRKPVGAQESSVAAIARGKQSVAPEVSSEERRHLAECCAFFKAERYRHAEPGTIRSSDVRKAEEEIDRVIKNSGTELQAPEGT
jgi:hypothetical protein